MMNFDEPLSKVQFLKMFGKRVRPGDSQTETGGLIGIYRLGLAALPNGSYPNGPIGPFGQREIL